MSIASSNTISLVLVNYKLCIQLYIIIFRLRKPHQLYRNGFEQRQCTRITEDFAWRMNVCLTFAYFTIVYEVRVCAVQLGHIRSTHFEFK